MEVAEGLETENNGNKFVAIYIAVLAVALSICAAGGGDVTNTVLTTNIQAANTYAFYQAKNIRQASLKLAADAAEIRLQEPGLPEAAKQALQEKLKSYRATADRYESEPATGEGKKELLAKARSLEAERDLAMKRGPYFDYGERLLQIAIVLASVSIILGGPMMLMASYVLSALGTLLTLNAFTLAVNIPFMG